jgi:hypothetical protein
LSSLAPTAAVAAAVRISEVRVEERPELLRANLERPVEGELVDELWLPLAGWALAPGGEVVNIQIDQGRQPLRRLARGVPRPDIALAYPEVAGSGSAGFSLALEAARLPREFDLRLSALIDSDAIPLGRIRGSRRRLEPAHELALAPLPVTTLGRTGSTLLLTLLSMHPSIAAFRPVAYDSRPLAYALEAASALAAPASRMRLLDSTADGGDWWLPRESLTVEALERLEGPVRELLVGAPLEELLQSALARATRFARDLAHADGGVEVRYAAEKCWPGHVPRMLHELCEEPREIFLVRDFRDVFASMSAFNAKRGFATFGRQDVTSDEEFVGRLALDAEALASAWRERGERALLVRYEELVGDPSTALEQLFEYLGVERSGARIGSIVADAHALLERTRLEHRTTDDTSASNGRWRKDLPAELQEACNEAFAGPLREFGYP